MLTISKERLTCVKMFSMENNFAAWLNSELNKRGWNQNHLAKKAGLASGTISNIVNGSKGMGIDTAVALARALNISPQTVLEAAGLLPPDPEADPGFEEWTYMLSQLPERDRDELLQIARLKLERQEKEEAARKRKGKS
jgi:transcriptional regulator with XRE-family HTH domain